MWVILAVTAGCLVGAAIVVLVVPARWEGHSRVVLDLIKPDPLTGQAIGGNSRAYAATQMELVKDYAVAGKVADQLGWLTDPTLIQRYQHRPSNDGRDFRRWIAQQVIDRTKAELVEGSNIMEITYTAQTADDAKAVADALMKAYVDSSVAFRRDEARRNADWFTAQSDKAKLALDQAAQTEADFQRQTGIILQDDKTDVDSAHLRALAQTATTPQIITAGAQQSPAAGELAQVDALIAQDSDKLGANHPDMIALKARRAALAAQVARDRTAAQSQVGALNVAAMNAAVAAQKTKVLGQSEKFERLRQLHAGVELLRDQYNKTNTKAAELKQEATIGETGLTVLGAAVTPQKPKFPNNPLIFGGALGLGLGSGVLIALLVELLGRRVRGLEDLKAIDAPVLAVVPTRKKAARTREAKPVKADRPLPGHPSAAST